MKQIIQTTMEQDDIFVSSLTNKDDKSIDWHSFYLILIYFWSKIVKVVFQNFVYKKKIRQVGLFVYFINMQTLKKLACSLNKYINLQKNIRKTIIACKLNKYWN